MAEKCLMCLLGLIILCPLLTANDTQMFCSSGENVYLLCNNALSDCTSTTWIYSRHLERVELIAGRIKKTDIERHERLSLGSDCSLTKENYGSYSCRQYVNGEQQGTDARVHLHVRHVSSSSSQTEISPGRSVTLFCQLYYYGVSCDTLVRGDGVELIWVNKAGVNLQTDSRYQISFSSQHCSSSLTTTLLNEDHNREWSCQLYQRHELKTSAAYTVKYSVSPSVIGIVVAAALAVLITAVILWVIYKKRADNKGTNDSVFTDKNNGTNTSNSSIHLTLSANEQKDDVTYTKVATYSKIQAKKSGFFKMYILN